MSLTRSDDHMYRWNDGDWLPGVTTVLKQVDKSGAFWAAASRIVAEKAVMDHDRLTEIMVNDGPEAATSWLKASTRDKTKKAMDLGTRVHAYAEDEAKGQTHVFADDVKPYVAQYREGFLDKYSPAMEHIEAMVYSEKGRYGGTLDAICRIVECPHDPQRNFRLEHGCRWLIDYKTTADKAIGKGERMFPYPEVGLQLAALGYADFIGTPDDDTQTPIPAIDHYGVVAITENDCQLIEYDVTEDDFRTFMAYRFAHDWHKTRKGSIKR